MAKERKSTLLRKMVAIVILIVILIALAAIRVPKFISKNEAKELIKTAEDLSADKIICTQLSHDYVCVEFVSGEPKCTLHETSAKSPTIEKLESILITTWECDKYPEDSTRIWTFTKKEDPEPQQTK